MDTQDTNPEQKIYEQEDINKGQARINYELNEVDKDVAFALKEIVKILKTVKALPRLMHDLDTIDFTKIDKVLSDVDQRNAEVASIKPPGCEPPYPPTGG